MCISAEQFCVCTGYWILKNNGDERTREREGDAKGMKNGIYPSELLANVSALILLEELVHCNAHRRAITASSSFQICRNK